MGILPPEIGKLPKVQRLLLSDNLLTALPLDIKNLTKLTVLDLENNPNLPIPSEIIAKVFDPTGIFSAYFDARRPLHEAKIILVGQGSVGKTSLVKRIIENNFNEQENKTEGIQISKWKVKRNRPLA